MFDKFFDIIINILSTFISDATREKINKTVIENLKKKKFFILCFFVLAIFSIVVCICMYISSINVTKVIISKNTLTMNVDDIQVLTATVLYSNNSTNNAVIWTSSDESIATIDKTGNITALSSGTTIITAQASKNNSTESAECELVVISPPSGYSISVQQTIIDSYAFIYVTPNDDNVTKIQIYAKSPSGEIFTPNKDENGLYRFYTECGTWTIYASVENEAGIYNANKSEDFVTIEVTNISPSQSPQGTLRILN